MPSIIFISTSLHHVSGASAHDPLWLIHVGKKELIEVRCPPTAR
jgi:hypothetical protein